MYYYGELVFKKLSNGKYIMIANRYGEIEKGFFTDEDLNYLKYVKDKCIPKLIQSVMDNGELNTPLRIRVA